MYKYAAIILAVVFLAACSHSSGIGVNKDYPIEPVENDTLLKQLTVKWNGALAPESIVKSVTVTGTRNISVRISKYVWDQGETDSCTDSAALSEEVFKSIYDAVTAADVVNYEAPAEGGPTCKIPGQTGINVYYLQTDGSENQFSTGTCAIEDKIDSLATVVSDAAKDAIPDCTEEKFAPAPQPTEEGTKPPAEETQKPPAEETQKPPAEETETPPPDETANPSGDNARQPPGANDRFIPTVE